MMDEWIRAEFEAIGALVGISRQDPDAVALALRIVARAIRRGEPVPVVLRGYVADALLRAAETEHVENPYGDNESKRLKVLGRELGILAGHRRRIGGSADAIGSFVCELIDPASGQGLSQTKAIEVAAKQFEVSVGTVRNRLREYRDSGE